MKVTLINYTQNALELLLFTKQTRLSMNAGLMEEIKAWPEEKKMAELNYMLGTIESSWEFVDFTFSIEGVSRAFTHQFVRTRSGSYAQQSQRTVDMSGFDFVMPEALNENQQEIVKLGLLEVEQTYGALLTTGANPQDARSILPTNVATSIIAKFNLRTLSDMAEKRLCTRTQGEYQDVFRAIRDAVIEAYPWTEPFIRVYCAKTGVCCFPNYKECPIKPGIFNPDTGGMWQGTFSGELYLEAIGDREGDANSRPLTKSEIQVRWEGTRFEAVPKGSGK